MGRNSFIRMSKLSNVRGRIIYISSHARQEYLYASYETTDRSYWTELAKCNRHEFNKSGTEGKCIEARELIIALPESFPELYNPDSLLGLFTDRFRDRYGVECVSALHHNKRKTNYHIHLIFSEREQLPQPIEKVATRNMFYDEQGNHVRTKKGILDENGDVRRGCRIVKKGEVYERTLFTAKNRLFKQEGFVDEAKRFYTDLINTMVVDEKDRLNVFERNSLYLATKKIGRNNPKAEQIRSDNEARTRWNSEVDRAIVSGMPEEEIRQVKREHITDAVKNSVCEYGEQPERLAGIITNAVTVLSKIIYRVVEKAMGIKAESHDEDKKIQEPEVAKKPTKIPPIPDMAEDAKAYPKLARIKKELDKQNATITHAEKERGAMEKERDDLKGLQILTRKSALQRQIGEKSEQIDILKAGLSGIVKRYGYRNVKEFYGEYRTVKKAYQDYQDMLKRWEDAYGESESTARKKISMHERIRENQKKAEELNRGELVHGKDRGAR